MDPNLPDSTELGYSRNPTQCVASACSLEELVSGLLRPKLFPFGKLSKAKPAAHSCNILCSIKSLQHVTKTFYCKKILTMTIATLRVHFGPLTFLNLYQ